MQHNRCGGKEWLACSGRGGYEVPRLILFFVAAKENSSACSGRSSDDLPRPILIFVVAKKNGFACRSRLGKEDWFRYPCRNNAPRSIFLKYT